MKKKEKINKSFLFQFLQQCFKPPRSVFVMHELSAAIA
jgi:hypothetical protein